VNAPVDLGHEALKRFAAEHPYETAAPHPCRKPHLPALATK
jgi:hypothetical protein